MEEQVFLDEKGVKVTNARFITYGKTQALAGITSVSTLVKNPNRLWPIILIILGGILAFNGEIGWGVLSLVGILWLVLQKSTYYVQLESASGISNALESKDKDFIFRVVDALNDAIVARG